MHFAQSGASFLAGPTFEYREPGWDKQCYRRVVRSAPTGPEICIVSLHYYMGKGKSADSEKLKLLFIPPLLIGATRGSGL